MNIKALESKCASYKKSALEHTHMVMKTRGEKRKREKAFEISQEIRKERRDDFEAYNKALVDRYKDFTEEIKHLHTETQVRALKQKWENEKASIERSKAHLKRLIDEDDNIANILKKKINEFTKSEESCEKKIDAAYKKLEKCNKKLESAYKSNMKSVMKELKRKTAKKSTKKTKTAKKSAQKTKRSRCPNGTRKNKKSGKCEKK